MLAGPRDTKAVQASSNTLGEGKLFDYIIKNPHEFNPNVPRTIWDFDWDKRDPASLVPPDRSPLLDGDTKKHKSQLSSAKPTATRHLFLIRHGQYNLKGISDEERTLTPLVSNKKIKSLTVFDLRRWNIKINLSTQRNGTIRDGSKQNLLLSDLKLWQYHIIE